MKIIRTLLALGAGVAFMPTPPDLASDPAFARGEDPGTFGYVIAATEAFADVKGFCQRKPEVCEAAGHMAVKMEAKAKYSAKLVYEWANETTADVSTPKGKVVIKAGL